MSNKRIIALSEKVTPDSGDFFAMDNSSGGTKKYQVKKILDQIAENAEDISDLNMYHDQYQKLYCSMQVLFQYLFQALDNLHQHPNTLKVHVPYSKLLVESLFLTGG